MMTMEDLERLRNTNLKIDAVNKRLDALGHMLVNSSDLKKIKPNFAGFTYDDSIDVTTIFQSENMTITLGIWHKKDMEYPMHCHIESIEYLICVKGSFVVNFDKYTRFLKTSECISLPINIKHNTIPLEDESIMVAICIPPEKAYLQCNERVDY